MDTGREKAHYPYNNNSFEYRLIREIVKEHPEISEIVERYFGENCLKRPSFKIQTLGMACILFGINQKRLLQELEKIQN